MRGITRIKGDFAAHELAPPTQEICTPRGNRSSNKKEQELRCPVKSIAGPFSLLEQSFGWMMLIFQRIYRMKVPAERVKVVTHVVTISGRWLTLGVLKKASIDCVPY